MEAVLSRLRGLSDDELREEFGRAGLNCAPITSTTRAILERKLARVLAGPQSSASETDSGSSTGASGRVADHAKPASCASSAGTASRGTSEAPGEELDFGYGVGLNPPEEEEISKTTSKGSTGCANSQSKTETPSKPAQVSPSCYYGVCPLWEDVLARNGKRLVLYVVKISVFIPKVFKICITFEDYC